MVPYTFYYPRTFTLTCLRKYSIDTQSSFNTHYSNSPGDEVRHQQVRKSWAGTLSGVEGGAEVIQGALVLLVLLVMRVLLVPRTVAANQLWVQRQHEIRGNLHRNFFIYSNI